MILQVNSRIFFEVLFEKIHVKNLLKIHLSSDRELNPQVNYCRVKGSSYFAFENFLDLSSQKPKFRSSFLRTDFIARARDQLFSLKLTRGLKWVKITWGLKLGVKIAVTSRARLFRFFSKFHLTGTQYFST